MCREIARAGLYVIHFISHDYSVLIPGSSAGGGVGDADSDDTSNDEDYGVNLD